MMRKTIVVFLLSWVFVATFIVTSVENANAIPPFARKYKTSCQTCHVAFPKLNPFGMAFRASGYRMPGGDEVFVKDEPVALGAPAYKRVWPKAVWPGDIPYLPPVGFTIFSNLWIGEDNETTTEFDGLEEFALLLGGTLGESWSFFFDYRLYLWGTQGWLDRAFVIYTPQWFEPIGIVNMQIGQFEPRATPFLGGHRNLITIKGTPMAVFWPVYPIGQRWGFFPNQKGIEFFGGLNGPKSNGGFEWAAGLVNGEQVDFPHISQGNATTTREVGRFDDNDFKDFYGRLSYKIGGMGVMGGEEVEEAVTAVENWQDGYTLFGNVKTSAKIGIFYYRGKSDFKKSAFSNVDTVKNQDRFSRYGVDVDWIIWNFNVIGGAVVYDDKLDKAVSYNSKTTATKDGLDDDFKTYIYMAEVDWVVYPWLIPAVRYEWIQPDYSYTASSLYVKPSENPVTTKNFERLTFDVTILLAANIKLLAGGHFSIEEPPPSGSHFRDYFRLGIDIAF
ncbi:MAG: hypothetical protein HYW14_00915 [Planctomycetes bacterium]|nr:hypothetical protein [Planctomycetota bacterium]